LGGIVRARTSNPSNPEPAMTTAAAAPVVTDEHKRQYQQEGYFILERAMSPEVLETLRGECQHFIDVINAEMDAAGVTVKGINHRDKRYFIANRYKDSQKLRDFLFGDTMADVVRATVGPTAYLFVEQFVVKMAEVG